MILGLGYALKSSVKLKKKKNPKNKNKIWTETLNLNSFDLIGLLVSPGIHLNLLSDYNMHPMLRTTMERNIREVQKSKRK